MNRRCCTVGIPVVAAAAMLAGCSKPPVEHDAEAHAVPPHHPRTFRRAIDEIERRCGCEGDARRELVDILRWLPALAADTELGRAAWDRVRSTAATLAIRLEPAALPDSFADLCRGAVAELRSAAATLPELPVDTADAEEAP